MNRKQFISRLGTLGAAIVAVPLATGYAASTATSSSSSPKKIRAGIIGCGSVSGVYLPHLAKCRYADVVSLCDIKPERAERRAREFNVKNHYPNIDAMLAGVPFDLLVNLTDMQAHGQLNRRALEAGKHVWSEKPMANTYDEGRELLDFAIRRGVRLWGAPAVVESPQFSFMAKQIDEGKLGRIAAAHAHYGHQGPHWSAFFYEKDGGSLPDLGVYNISTLTGLFGPVKSLVAMTNTVTPERKIDDRGVIRVEAEDNAMIIMAHEKNSVLSHIQCGFNYFDPYGHAGTGQERPTVSIVGSEGNMHLIGYDWMPFGVDIATVANERTQRFATDSQGFKWEEGASAVCECLATGKEPKINAEHALHVLEIIEATRRSQAEGRRIQLKSTFNF
ncbi:MAG: Gfo/Idh/MocA family oxidoreductase [Prevotellaceae bacterium]|jgi:predicted dehydrogenase|nr:Gfo/Idh/MocA family oxidoreductase [Prevotellaceae bacterium]